MELKSLSLTALTNLLKGMGEPAFRAKQVFGWLHQKDATAFDEMTTLSHPLRQSLAQNHTINTLQIEKKLQSALDGTIKYLYRLADGNCVEAVCMQYHHAASLCISTQVGCRMGCGFCASTLNGLVRNLTPAEMLDQIYATELDTGTRVGSVVLMGIGEPLDNLENVLVFLQNSSNPLGRNLGLRHITISTCGVVPRMDELAAHRLPVTLSVSLHAATDHDRSQIMPVNRSWPIATLLAACERYFALTGRRITYEYALIDKLNDSRENAVALAALLHGKNCHVNLIPINPVLQRDYRRSHADSVRQFQKTLGEHRITATIRRSLGADIEAACGQLRHTYLDADN